MKQNPKCTYYTNNNIITIIHINKYYDYKIYFIKQTTLIRFQEVLNYKVLIKNHTNNY